MIQEASPGTCIESISFEPAFLDIFKASIKIPSSFDILPYFTTSRVEITASVVISGSALWSTEMFNGGTVIFEEYILYEIQIFSPFYPVFNNFTISVFNWCLPKISYHIIFVFLF